MFLKVKRSEFFEPYISLNSSIGRDMDNLIFLFVFILNVIYQRGVKRLNSKKKTVIIHDMINQKFSFYLK
jgi:hypothetical protein